MSQSVPVFPSTDEQLHIPVTWSHVALFPHEQTCLHSSPYFPSSQALIYKEKLTFLLMHGATVLWVITNFCILWITVIRRPNKSLKLAQWVIIIMLVHIVSNVWAFRFQQIIKTTGKHHDNEVETFSKQMPYLESSSCLSTLAYTSTCR